MYRTHHPHHQIWHHPPAKQRDPSPMGWGKVPTWIKIRKWMDTWLIAMVLYVFVPEGSGSWICFLLVDFFKRDSTMGSNHHVSPLFGENMFFSSKHQRSKSKGYLRVVLPSIHGFFSREVILSQLHPPLDDPLRTGQAIPIPSMYGILCIFIFFTYIYHVLPLKTTIHVGNYYQSHGWYGIETEVATGT